MINVLLLGTEFNFGLIPICSSKSSDSQMFSSICPGSQYWVFKDTVAMSGYPRPLSEWGMRSKRGMLVDRVDAAFIWAHNGKTYLFSGGEFWRFEESWRDEQVTRNLEPGYPRDNNLWAGVPPDMDDIISWGEGNIIFKHTHVMNI